MKNKAFYLIILILIILLSIFLTFQNYKLREKLRKYDKYKSLDINYPKIKQILSTYLLKHLMNNKSKWTLVIIFSPEDCPYCLEEISYLANLCEMKNVKCFGLVSHPYKELVEKFIKNMKWDFPIYITGKSPWGYNFGIRKTPIKILLNDKNQIYYVEGPLSNWKTESKLKILIQNTL
ncbi:redoxin family protein [Candidatus Aminicenantes bacterium AC-335-B20]|jgi:thiol-disulfide isomerase/thioredoxin|nr:redoxin family protein [SCandidatus Aminicenantes bacterium Aminicenantia_JdfR_composite]MCP2598546.1 redoxin family protein [Candidatus Aminicenantes bacterium AC-335-L06]MCP2598859.1 redoxin family protein [Candidatus Aminicenantes bacterium AC-335-B20]